MVNLRRIKGNTIEIFEDGYFKIALTANLMECFAVIKGPKDTPYEGGSFLIRLEYPDDYPFDPIRAQFISKIYHPNISSQTGAVCLDVLTKPAWSPAITTRLALLSLETMLDTPVPDDPMDAVVARLCINDPEAFAAKAREWTRCYAKGSVQIERYRGSEPWMEYSGGRDTVRVNLTKVDSSEAQND